MAFSHSTMGLYNKYFLPNNLSSRCWYFFYQQPLRQQNLDKYCSGFAVARVVGVKKTHNNGMDSFLLKYIYYYPIFSTLFLIK